MHEVKETLSNIYSFDVASFKQDYQRAHQRKIWREILISTNVAVWVYALAQLLIYLHY